MSSEMVMLCTIAESAGYNMVDVLWLIGWDELSSQQCCRRPTITD